MTFPSRAAACSTPNHPFSALKRTEGWEGSWCISGYSGRVPRRGHGQSVAVLEGLTLTQREKQMERACLVSWCLRSINSLIFEGRKGGKGRRRGEKGEGEEEKRRRGGKGGEGKVRRRGKGRRRRGKWRRGKGRRKREERKKEKERRKGEKISQGKVDNTNIAVECCG